jgi:hypothetical protein
MTPRTHFEAPLASKILQAMNAEGVNHVSVGESLASVEVACNSHRLSELNLAVLTLVSRSSLQKHFH